MKLTIAQDTWKLAKEEVLPLADAYWAEVRGSSQPETLDVNPETYAAHEAAGSLVLVTARGSGKVVGFTMFFAFIHHHYQSTLSGHEDSWYVLPAYRRGTNAGIRLLRVALEVLTDMGCTHAYAGTMYQNDVTPILRRVGFVPVETIHCVVLA